MTNISLDYGWEREWNFAPIVAFCTLSIVLVGIVRRCFRAQTRPETVPPVRYNWTLIEEVFRDDFQVRKILVDVRCAMGSEIVLDGVDRRVMTSSPWGKIPVYLLGEHVIKDTGNQRICTNRVRKLKFGQKICDELGLTHLVIPKARVSGKLLIAERLPVNCDIKYQMGLYIENRDLFNGAARDYFLFLFHTHLDGTTFRSEKYDWHSFLTCYDNFCLFVQDGVGKVGLLDLEHLQEQVGDERMLSVSDCCSLALHLFPCHIEEVLEAAREVDSVSTIHQYQYEHCTRSVISQMTDRYTLHREFVLEKGLDYSDSIEFPVLSEERKRDFTRWRYFPEVMEIIRNLAVESSKKDSTSLPEYLMARTVVFDLLEGPFNALYYSRIRDITGCAGIDIFGSKEIFPILLELRRGGEIQSICNSPRSRIYQSRFSFSLCY